MRILTSRDCNIRRIGSLQSRISIPSAEVICVAVTVSDSVFRRNFLLRCFGRDGRRSSKHHRLGIPLMATSTMLSPSRFPQTSNEVSEREKQHKRYRPLKTMASFGIQTLPKARVSLSVSRNTWPVSFGLSMRTLTLLCWKVSIGSIRKSPPYASGNVGSVL